MKVKFSGAGIAGFFANNGEKMVLGLMVFILLWFLYGAITAKPLDDTKSPESIVRESDQAKKRINSVDFKDSGETVTATDFKKLIEEDQKEIPLAKLQERNEWNPRLFPELTKRPDPDIYPVADLQIAGGDALIPYAHPDAAGHAAAAPAAASTASGTKIAANTPLPGVRATGAEVRPAYYAIITGAIPFDKQAQEYQRRFEFAVKPNAGQPNASSDIELPRYYFFNVQRADVKDANDTNPKWVDIDWHFRLPDAGKPLENKWAVVYPEIVQKEYVLPAQARGPLNFYVTWPLPPVFLKFWGLEASNPKVQLIKTEGAAEPAAAPAEAPASTNPLDVPGAAGVPGGGAPVTVAHKPSPAVNASKLGNPARPGGMQSEAASGVNYKLFRFVDLTAEKGKNYRYRVQLILANPNHGVAPENLENPKSSASEWLNSPWSEATALVTIPPDVRILADGVATARGIAEPQAKIHVLTLLQDEKSSDWVEVAKDFEVPLGGYVWFKDVKIENVPDMAADEIRTVTAPTINADQSMLLDLRNDDLLGGNKSKGPTEMLFIDAAGRLSVSNSAVDAPILKDFQQRNAVTAEAAPAK